MQLKMFGRGSLAIIGGARRRPAAHPGAGSRAVTMKYYIIQGVRDSSYRVFRQWRSCVTWWQWPRCRVGGMCVGQCDGVTGDEMIAVRWHMTSWHVTRWPVDTHWTHPSHQPPLHSLQLHSCSQPCRLQTPVFSLEWKETPKCAYVICEQTLTCVHTYDQHTKFLNNNTIWTSRSALLTRIWTSSDCSLAGVWWRAGCFLSARTQK